VGSAPALRRIEATFVGTPAHAGIVPEAGRSAIAAASAAVARMPLGRIDEDTTANIGTIKGGTATNVVAERCTVTAEARSRSHPSLVAQTTAMLDALAWAASEAEVDLEVRVENEFTGYALGERDPQVAVARRALESLGYSPRLVASGGGSDVNAFLADGFPSVNLCNDMIDVHTDRERIAVSSLERMVDVTLAIVAEVTVAP
jgi:tripeptide aminopeptidase